MDFITAILILSCSHILTADQQYEFKSSAPKAGSIYEAIKNDYEEFIKSNKNKLPKPPKSQSDLIAAISNGLTNNRKKVLYNFNDTRFRDSLVNRMTSEGVIQIKAFGKLMRKNIKTSIDARNISKNIVKRIAEDYENNLRIYYSYLQSETTKGRPANELILADLIDISNRVLMAQKRRMLHEFIEKTKKHIEKSNFDAIAKQLNSDKINNKKNNLIWVCLKIRVCKPYPGYTDYFADILNYAVKLQDTKYTTFLSTALNVMKNMTVYMDKFINNNNSRIVLGMLNPEFNTSFTKKVLSEIAVTIVNKQKYVYNKHPIMRAVGLSKRILTEMVDKVFYKQGEDMVRIEFENTLSALKKWDAGQREDLSDILYYYFGNFIRQCSAAWKNEYHKEVNCLVEIIMNGEPRNQTLARNILTNGSEYVNFINTRIG